MKHEKQAPRRDPGRNALQGGAYSLAAAAILLAILIAVNVFAGALPPSLTRFDISAAKLYSITSNTKVVVNGLDQDVTIYWIVQSGAEDDVIETLLSKYESLSGHITVEKRNPDVYPTFAEQYTDGEVQNNSLVVECGERSRYIPYSDIYIQEADLYSYAYSTSFDGEGAITSAIDYVTTDELPVLYLTEGHGEAELPATFADQIEKSNIETQTLSLLTVDEIPEDAACVLVYSPASDISETERDLLQGYLDGGGHLMVAASMGQAAALTNLESLLTGYGVTPVEGVVVEGDRSAYTVQPYILLPQLEESDITAPLLEERYFAAMPIAQGLVVDEDATGVTTLMTTSDVAFSKAAGYDLTTYEKEDGDTDGPFALAVDIDCGSGGRLCWFGSSYFLDDMYNALSSGANVDLAMNALSSLIGETEAMAIRSKSLNYNYLSISGSTASLLKVVMIGVFPLTYLGVGIALVVKRRRLQNEAR